MAIDRITIKGFRSIQSLDNFPLKNLNVLIGANGSGKSSLINFFAMVRELIEGRLQVWTSLNGTANRLLTFGAKQTPKLEASLDFNDNTYTFELGATAEYGFTFLREAFFYGAEAQYQPLGEGHTESRLIPTHYLRTPGAKIFHEALANIRLYHLNDTSLLAKIKAPEMVHDYDYLRSDGSNLAAFLYHMHLRHPMAYEKLRRIIQLVLPFFDDFDLRPEPLASGDEQIRLFWRQKDKDYRFSPSQFSDGSLRFIFLATALLQPALPSTILIDEPELGLHPSALAALAGLIRSAAGQTQVIIALQSTDLINEFEINDFIVTELEGGTSRFRRLKEHDFTEWLKDYSVGELWQKNVLEGPSL